MGTLYIIPTVSSKRYVREFKFENAEEYTLGAEIKADIFAAGDKVDASAISKGLCVRKWKS